MKTSSPERKRERESNLHRHINSYSYVKVCISRADNIAMPGQTLFKANKALVSSPSHITSSKKILKQLVTDLDVPAIRRCSLFFG